MTTFRDDNDAAFQTHIDGLTHSSISTKLSVIETLETQLQTEQTALETQRAQLHKHKQLVSDLTTDLKTITSGQEYTVSGGGGGSGDPTALGKKIYVNASYSGGSDDGSAEKPYASLAAAIVAKCGVADATERIFVIAAGTYTVSKTIVKNVNVKQKCSFIGQGSGVTFLEAAASFAAGKDIDCLKLSNFGGLRFEKLTIRRCRYGIRAISCDDLHITHCMFTKCGAPATDTYYDGSISQSAQATAYANDMSNGGGVRIELAEGTVRLLHNQVRYCLRGLRAQDCMYGGLIQGNTILQTVESGIYLASSSDDGNNGCQGIIVQNNDVNQACNNSYLCIGGRDNVICDNVARSGFNTGIMLWHCCQTTVSGNKIEKCNSKIYNGLGVLSDSWAGGLFADGDTNIYGSATYQCKIFDNHITECGIGRAAQNFAMRIGNDAFSGAADKCYVGGNQSQDADIHFKNDEGVTVLDMETRTVPEASGIRKNTNIRVVTVTAAGDTPLLNTDWLVVISHDAVSSVTCTLPEDAAHGQIICVKNGSNSSAGTTSTDIVVETSGDTSQLIDGRFSGITLRGSDSQSGGTENESNQAARMIFDNVSDPDGIWWSVSDAF